MENISASRRGDNLLFSGYILTAISAVTFSAKGIFAKIIYGYGVDPVTLLALRFVIALPLFWAAMYFHSSEKVSKKDLLIILLSGIFGLYAAALADFYGLLYIDATLERIILYTYPAMVVVWTAVFFKERLGRKKILSIALSYAGVLLALKVFDAPANAQLLGAGLVLFSAFVYSFSYIITESVSRRVSAIKISTYTTTAATFAFLFTWHGKSIPTEPIVWAHITLIAVAFTFVPVITLAMGIKRIGAGKAAVIGFIGPISTLVLAYFILGERIDLIQGIGMCVIMAGVYLISREKKELREG